MINQSSTTSNSVSKEPRFLELDALRGIAALLVLSFHYTLWNPDLLKYTCFGSTGVDLFFIISGFVIMMSLSKIKFGYQFVINRFSRLYPTYWAAVTFTFIIITITETYLIKPAVPTPWSAYWYNMTMFQHYYKVADLDGPYWTMVIEMLFYGIMLVLFLTKSLQSVVVILFMICTLGLVLMQFYWGGEFPQDYFSDFPLAAFLPLFLSGILFYKLYNEKKASTIILIIGCYLLQILLFKQTGRSNDYILFSDYKAVLGIYFTLFFLFTFGKLSWIVNKYTLFLGKISFSLYLIHQYISLYLIIQPLTNLGWNYSFVAFGIALPTCILIATFLTYCVEKPVSKWVKIKLTHLFSQHLIPRIQFFQTKIQNKLRPVKLN